MVLWVAFSYILFWIRLMCVLRLSIFRNILSEIEKTVNTFSIFEKIFSKNKNYCIPSRHILAKSFYFSNYNVIIRTYLVRKTFG